jgi:hypothetical protein
MLEEEEGMKEHIIQDFRTLKEEVVVIVAAIVVLAVLMMQKEEQNLKELCRADVWIIFLILLEMI